MSTERQELPYDCEHDPWLIKAYQAFEMDLRAHELAAEAHAKPPLGAEVHWAISLISSTRYETVPEHPEAVMSRELQKDSTKIFNECERGLRHAIRAWLRSGESND